MAPSNRPSPAPHPSSASVDLSSVFAYSASHPKAQSPGPASYSTQGAKDAVLNKPPRAAIGRERRFNSHVSSFLPAQCASELQCRDSPGPIYDTQGKFPTSHSAPAYSWGKKPSKAEVAQRNKERYMREATLGPAHYQLNFTPVTRTSERTVFGKSDRFLSFGGHAYMINNSPYATSAGPAAAPKFDYTRPTSAAFSFAGQPRTKQQNTKSRPRTAFMTHSIAGGFARPATLECGIGPGDYNTNIHDISHNLSYSKGKNFGSAQRFQRAGLEYISSEHAKAEKGSSSPGPKYYSAVNSCMYKPKAVQNNASMTWVP